MTLNQIEYVKRELRKALGGPDASDIIFDNNTHFKVQSVLKAKCRPTKHH